jgi:hypothetical protein
MKAFEDDDIKIADGHYSAPKPEDTSERAAREYLDQKRAGNIDRARELGRLLARAVLDERGPLADELTGKSMQARHHIYLLYTYVANRAIAEKAPSSILAQTSLSEYFKEIEAVSPELYRHVNDMAAFSLYIRCERSRTRTDDEIGRIFAELAGCRDDHAMAAYGNGLFRGFYDACEKQIEAVPYVEI